MLLTRTLFLQEAVDNQVALIASEPFDWVLELPMHSEYKFEYAGEQFQGILQFLAKDQSRERNSFMLSISIRLSPSVYKSYTSGFFFEEQKIIKFITNSLELSK